MPSAGAFLDWLRTVPWTTAAWLALAENAAILVLAVAAGEWAVRRFRHRPVSEPPLPLTRLEIAAATGGVGLNAAVTVAGLYLWRRGVIRLRGDVGLRSLLDVPILLLVMDALMYALHRVAHLPASSCHALHHQERDHDFGFYTLIWDRLLGTLRPDYDQAYGRPPARQES